MEKDWRQNPEEASPFWRLLGMRLIKAEAGEAHLVMEASSQLTQAYGIMHGGALASLADSAAALALASLTGDLKKLSTVELAVNYLRPVQDGIIHAYAKVIHLGGRLSLIEVKLTNENDQMVCFSKATYYVK